MPPVGRFYLCIVYNYRLSSSIFPATTCRERRAIARRDRAILCFIRRAFHPIIGSLKVADRPTGEMAASMALQDRLPVQAYRFLLLATVPTGLCAGIDANQVRLRRKTP